MTKRFEFAYNALVQAFFNGTLAKGLCTCCAVGSIVGASQESGQLTKEEFEQSMRDDFLYTSHERKITGAWRSYICDQITSEYLESMLPCGYTGEELVKIEEAFEKNTKISVTEYSDRTEQEILEDQYNGLCAVFEVLCKLDNVEDVDYKAKLQEKPGLVLA